MRILIDCDGPIFDWAGHLERSLMPDDYTRGHLADCRRNGIYDIFESRAGFLRHANELFADVDEWRKIPEVDGAREAIRSLIADGHEVSFVSKPWASVNFDDWFATRHGRLCDVTGTEPVRLRAQGEHRVHNTPDYDLLIDDCPANVNAWREAGGRALLFGTEYNRGGGDWTAILHVVNVFSSKPAVVVETPAVATKGKRPPQIIVDALTARARDLLDAYEHGHDSQSLCLIITLLQHLVDQERGQ